ncbi:hypothetical protein 32HC_15 [Mycobacterium phage 32HC]|uniref:Head-to-tail adaptor n=1 Tax=Mycobacterium phage 32HC TaxID=1445729 RepID=W8EAD4_9CAUD|nr:Gp19/Gp15/Gp42 family protein [Mycobacterium phage 32HC]AHJ86293.1 hypothetical protein 32HC_15 [Mycobacterium phage 32HC]
MGGVVSPILSKADFVKMFRPLVGAEDELADLLLMSASNQIRRRFYRAGVDLDESDPDIRLVIFEVVAAVLRPGTYAGYSSITITTDDATESRVFANPSALLDISDAQWRRLGIEEDSVAPRGCFPVGDY